MVAKKEKIASESLRQWIVPVKEQVNRNPLLETLMMIYNDDHGSVVTKKTERRKKSEAGTLLP